METITLHTPVFFQPSSGDPDITYTAIELRNMIRSLVSHADGFAPQQGVLGGANGGLGYTVSAGSGFNVSIPTGRALIQDDDVTNGGTAICWNDAAVTLAVPTPPSSGTSLHRVVLQMRNKLENGTWTTYDFLPVLVPDATPGDNTLPAEPNSAITLASVAIPSTASSVSSGGTITDLRESSSTVAAYKAGNTARTATTAQTKDPDLQLNNLASGAQYEMFGVIAYTAPQNGDLKWSFNVSNCTMIGGAGRQDTTPSATIGYAWTDQTTGTASGGGTGGVNSTMATILMGAINVSAATNATNFARFSWAQNTSNGTTTVLAGSFLRARRIS